MKIKLNFSFKPSRSRSPPAPERPTEVPRPPPISCRKCHLTFSSELNRWNHIKLSPNHITCRYCSPVKEFGSESELHAHYRHRHIWYFCQYCNVPYNTREERRDHCNTLHPQCILCFKGFSTPEGLDAHYRTAHLHSHQHGHGPHAHAPPQNPRDQSNYYSILGISPHSTHEQIVKASRDMRVKTHPDRLKRREGLTEEIKHDIDAKAALVGQAADVLSDPTLRANYDRSMGGFGAPPPAPPGAYPFTGGNPYGGRRRPQPHAYAGGNPYAGRGGY